MRVVADAEFRSDGQTSMPSLKKGPCFVVQRCPTKKKSGPSERADLAKKKPTTSASKQKKGAPLPRQTWTAEEKATIVRGLGTSGRRAQLQVLSSDDNHPLSSSSDMF